MDSGRRDKAHNLRNHPQPAAPRPMSAASYLRGPSYARVRRSILCVMLACVSCSMAASATAPLQPEVSSDSFCTGTDSMSAARMRKAIVFGSTGASGRALVADLAQNGWQVTAVTRREIQDLQAAFPALKDNLDRVTPAVVDYEALESHAGQIAGHDAAFCVLGTTHGDAGSRDAFDRVDRVYVSEAARLSKGADIPVFVLMTAQGTRDYIPRWMSSYTWSKAQAEKAVRELNFQHTYIIRPGMLEREDKARPMEKFIGNFLSGISMQSLATAMRQKATEFLDGKDPEAVSIMEGNGVIENFIRRTD